MARRLLGADSATVFNIQEPEEETAHQVPRSSGLLRQITITGSALPTFFMDATPGSVLWKVQGRSKKSILLVFLEHMLCARHCVK